MPNGRWVIVLSWRQYKRGKDPLDTKHKFLVNCQVRVLTEFWSYFQMEPDCNRDECIAQSRRAAVKQVTDTMHARGAPWVASEDGTSRSVNSRCRTSGKPEISLWSRGSTCRYLLRT